MSSFSLWRRGLVLATIGVAGALRAPSARACIDPPPPPPIWVQFITPTQALVCVHDYLTFGATPGHFCVCALNQVGPIVEVKSLTIVSKLDGTPIAGWDFQANDNTSLGFGKVAPGSWAGFSSAVTETIPGGIPVNLKFLVNLAPGSTPDDLLLALNDPAVPLVGSDEGDAAGNLTGNHLGINPSGGAGAMPPNDDCFDRILLPGDGTYEFSNIGALLDGPLPTCSSQLEADVWFNYVAQADGTLRVDTCGSDFDTILVVYDNCLCPVDPVREVACNDDFCGLQSSVEVPVVAGGCYKIQAGGYQGAQGFGVLNVICIPQGGPPNDLCGDRILLPGDGLYTFDTTGASTDGPANCAASGLFGADIWYNYFAAQDGTLEVSTCGSPFDTVVSVYGVCACPADPVFLLGCNDDAPAVAPCAGTTQSWLSVPVVGGDCYKIQVGGWNGQTGPGTLEVVCVPPPPLHPVSDHVWSNFHVLWGQGDWTVDGTVVCTTFPGGIRTGGPGDPTHAWDYIDCPDWPNDWHWDAQFMWGDFDVTVSVWFQDFLMGDDLSVWIHCWNNPDGGPGDYTLMVDTVNDTYAIPEAGFTGTWSDYPDDLPPEFEPTPSFRTNNEGVGDPDLVRAQGKLQDAIQQVSDTTVQVTDAIQQVQTAQVLDDKCGACADAADAELLRAEGKLEEVLGQLDTTIGQLQESLSQIEEAKFLIEVGGPPLQIVDLLNRVIMNLQRANEELGRAIAKMDEAISQLMLAEQLLADCGTCAAQAQEQIERAIGKLQRGIEKLDRAIQKLNDVYLQVKVVRDRYACPGDTNFDRVVDVNDLNAVILGWGGCPQPEAGVP